MPAGRPTIYNEEILTKTKEYIDSCTDIIVDVSIDPNKPIYKTKVNIPTIEGLAYHLGINKDTIYTWRKEKSEFSDLIEELLAKQAKELVNKGLSGDYNSTIAKVLLTKHGYREGIDATTDDKPIGEQSPESKAKALAFEEWYKNQISKE